MDQHTISYQFSLVNGIEKCFSFNFDISKKILNKRLDQKLPEWTALHTEQCPNCPLMINYCPLAVSLVDIIEKFDGISSYEKADLLIATREKNITIKTTVLKGMSSLIGIAAATSNCPHMSFFTPMAYFHKPLSRAHETVFRSVSSHLLSQHFFQEECNDILLKIDSLSEIYEDLQTVNRYIVRRLHLASKTNSAATTIAVIDGYAQALPMMMNTALDEVMETYSEYYEDISKPAS